MGAIERVLVADYLKDEGVCAFQSEPHKVSLVGAFILEPRCYGGCPQHQCPRCGNCVA